MVKEKKYFMITGGVIALLLLMIAGIMSYIDPVFHYHGPIKGIAYKLYEGERYVNDGITRHFDYNAVITGTSMTENFKTSECDEIFGVTSIKVPFAGAHYKEINENLKTAFKTHDDIKMVIRCIDTFTIIDDKDAQRQDDYPIYLTNSNVLDDVKYIFNKEMLFNAFRYTVYGLMGEEMTSLDEHAFWGGQEFEKDYALKNYNGGRWIENGALTEDEIQLIEDNVDQNIVSTIEDNPECRFFIFFQPSSVLYYDYLFCNGEFYKIWQGEKIIVEKLLQYENVKMYGWANQYELTTDLSQYRDISHYDENTNSDMLNWMANDIGLLTKDNYLDYFNECVEFYESYDYEAIFQK